MVLVDILIIKLAYFNLLCRSSLVVSCGCLKLFFCSFWILIFLFPEILNALSQTAAKTVWKAHLVCSGFYFLMTLLSFAVLLICMCWVSDGALGVSIELKSLTWPPWHGNVWARVASFPPRLWKGWITLNYSHFDKCCNHRLFKLVFMDFKVQEKTSPTPHERLSARVCATLN